MKKCEKCYSSLKFGEAIEDDAWRTVCVLWMKRWTLTCKSRLPECTEHLELITSRTRCSLKRWAWMKCTCPLWHTESSFSMVIFFLLVLVSRDPFSPSIWIKFSVFQSLQLMNHIANLNVSCHRGTSIKLWLYLFNTKHRWGALFVFVSQCQSKIISVLVMMRLNTEGYTSLAQLSGIIKWKGSSSV